MILKVTSKMASNYSAKFTIQQDVNENVQGTFIFDAFIKY